MAVTVGCMYPRTKLVIVILFTTITITIIIIIIGIGFDFKILIYASTAYDNRVMCKEKGFYSISLMRMILFILVSDRPWKWWIERNELCFLHGFHFTHHFESHQKFLQMIVQQANRGVPTRAIYKYLIYISYAVFLFEKLSHFPRGSNCFHFDAHREQFINLNYIIFFSPVTWEFRFVCSDLVWVVDIWWFVYLDWNSIRLMFSSCIFRLLRNYYRSFMKLQLVWWWNEWNRFLLPSQKICCFGKIHRLSAFFALPLTWALALFFSPSPALFPPSPAYLSLVWTLQMNKLLFLMKIPLVFIFYEVCT